MTAYESFMQKITICRDMVKAELNEIYSSEQKNQLIEQANKTIVSTKELRKRAEMGPTTFPIFIKHVIEASKILKDGHINTFRMLGLYTLAWEKFH